MHQMLGLTKRIEAIRGVNYVPSNAVNATQMWIEFDATTIDRELGFAEGLGLNSIRVFIQYVAYEHEPARFLERFEALLELASRHGLSVMPVLLDDCWLPEPHVDNQAPEPRPGLHNPYWQRSPGRRRMGLAYRPALRQYVEDILGRFGRDQRVIAWDLYNEPRTEDDSVALLRDVFAWARRVIEWARSYARPVVATEALGRPNHGEPHEILPLFAEQGIGWYLWELMIGADQTRYQWPDSPPVTDGIVFQGLLYPDGTPYREDEVQLIRSS